MLNDEDLQVIDELELHWSEHLSLVGGALFSYGEIAVDCWAAYNYHLHKDEWWFWLTISFMVLPGLWISIAQHFTFYYERTPPPPINTSEADMDSYPLLQRREITAVTAVPLTCLNITRMRLFYEVILSYRWGFETGAFRDIRVSQAIFQSLPQSFLQLWVIYRQWNVDVGPEFSFIPVIVALCFGVAGICTVPHSSPCFEDPDRMMVEMKSRAGMDAEETEDMQQELAAPKRSVSFPDAGMRS